MKICQKIRFIFVYLKFYSLFVITRRNAYWCYSGKKYNKGSKIILKIWLYSIDNSPLWTKNETWVFIPQGFSLPAFSSLKRRFLTSDPIDQNIF